MASPSPPQRRRSPDPRRRARRLPPCLRPPGYAIGVLNTSLTAVLDDLDTDADSLLSSAVVAGAALGALVSGKLADALGPRRAQLLNTVPFAAGAALCAASRSPAVFILSRLVVGFGAGAASLLTPRYIAEISVPALRGRIGSQHQVRGRRWGPSARPAAPGRTRPRVGGRGVRLAPLQHPCRPSNSAPAYPPPPPPRPPGVHQRGHPAGLPGGHPL